MSKQLFAVALAALSLGNGAWAHPGPSIARDAVMVQGAKPTYDGRMAPETTGSILAGPAAQPLARDTQGRDIRSSTRGNAQFPERPLEAQNLGGTSGGPAF
jgi:hypothetical protein